MIGLAEVRRGRVRLRHAQAVAVHKFPLAAWRVSRLEPVSWPGLTRPASLKIQMTGNCYHWVAASEGGHDNRGLRIILDTFEMQGCFSSIRRPPHVSGLTVRSQRRALI